MEHEVSISHSQGSTTIPIANRINSIPRIDFYLLRPIRTFSSHLFQGFPGYLFSVGLPVKILKVLYVP
jgi:hypothetical protein